MSNNPVSPGGNPFLGGAPHDSSASSAAAEPSAASIWLAVAVSVLVNLAGLIGVLAFGWPAGNVLALFWIENLILGFWSLIRVATARGSADGGAHIKMRGSGRTPSTQAGTALFFCFHYGIFCLVHGVFTAVVAFKIGFEPSVVWLGVPALLIMVRYAAETVTTWFGSHGQRDRLSAQGAMALPYPRIIVLHVALIVSFGLTLATDDTTGFLGGIRDAVQVVQQHLPVDVANDGVMVILILILIKTVADIKTTWTALHK